MAENKKSVLKKINWIRWEAVVPFAILCALVFFYFTLLFDLHLKKTIEWVGYQIIGAEVNVGSLKTSFLKGTLRIQNIELTNSEQPERNSIVFGDIRFAVLWDGLLRGKIVINEMAVEQIQVDSLRKRPGKVKPPEPPSTEPSFLEKEGSKLKDKALQKAQEEYSGNILGDAAALLSGGSAQGKLGEIEGTIETKKKLEELNRALSEKQVQWKAKIEALPKGPEIEALGTRLGQIKTKDFKTPQELQDSINQFNAIVREADEKYKSTKSTGDGLASEIQAFQKEVQQVDEWIRNDIKNLEARFRIPQLSADAITKYLFQKYLGPYVGLLNKYRGMAEKYVPPNLMKKGSSEPEIEIKPSPRANGISYEFGRPNSYPFLWIKRIGVSSKASGQSDMGDLSGEVLDIASHPALIGKPTVLNAKGGFPGKDIHGISLNMKIDNTQQSSLIDFSFQISDYPLEQKNLVQSDEVTIAFQKARGQLALNGALKSLSELEFRLDNRFQKVEYQTQAKNPELQRILTTIFNGIPTVTLDARARGELPDLAYSFNSNLGPEIQKGLEGQIRKRIEELRAQVKAYVDAQVSIEKAKLEAEFQKLKSQIEGEVKKVEAQIQAEQAKANAQIEAAKKDADDQKRKAEQEVKKAIGEDGQKKIEDLKKKLGL